MSFAVFFLFILLIGSVVPEEDESASDFFVYGGTPTNILKFPYIVSLKNDGNKHMCGGVILDRNLVLTAAHCLEELEQDFENWKVIAGRTVHEKEEEGEQFATIDSVENHRNYSRKPVANDIGVVWLKKGFQWTAQVQPARLNFRRKYDVGENLTIAGWGVTISKHPSKILLEADIPMKDHQVCRKLFRGNYSPTKMICAGNIGRDACKGDSGGPLVSDLGELIGLVSYGRLNRCGAAEAAVYTDVKFYSDWIMEKMEKKQKCSCPVQDNAVASCEGRSRNSKFRSLAALATKFNYTHVLSKSILFYEAQRSGKLPPTNRIPYRKDSALGDKGLNGEDLTGGYYDAGDHVKYGFPMAFSVTVLAWSLIDYPQGYAVANQVQYGMDAVKWGTDYFIKAHVRQNILYAQVGDTQTDHDYWGRPEEMTVERPVAFISPTAPGSDLAGETAASLAAASILFKSSNPDYSAEVLEHAIQLYSFAKTYTGKYSDSVRDASSYRSSSFGDELAWAATWLYRATGKAVYLAEAKKYYDQYSLGSIAPFSWDNKAGGVQVLLAKLTREPIYLKDIQTYCDNMLKRKRTPKGLAYILSEWGTLRYAAHASYICLQAADLGINASAYRNFAKTQIEYALGSTGRSFVVGFGTSPPTHAHHRSSSCPNMPAPCDWQTFSSPEPNVQVLYGALVGGPAADDSYSDDRSDYVRNQVSIEYNAGFQGAVAALNQLAATGVFA